MDVSNKLAYENALDRQGVQKKSLFKFERNKGSHFKLNADLKCNLILTKKQ